jgi:hypothetical protein
VERSGAPLHLDRLQPGIFTGRLIKMSMDTDKILHIQLSF